MPYQKLIKNTNTVPSGKKKKKTAQYKYPFITLQQAVMTQQLEARGGEREGNRGAAGLRTLQAPPGGHRGAATLSAQPSPSSNWELNKPQGTGGHSSTRVAVDKPHPLP